LFVVNRERSEAVWNTAVGNPNVETEDVDGEDVDGEDVDDVLSKVKMSLKVLFLKYKQYLV